MLLMFLSGLLTVVRDSLLKVVEKSLKGGRNVVSQQIPENKTAVQ